MITSHENTARDCNRAHAGAFRASRFARALHGTGAAGALALLFLILPIHSAHAAITFLSAGGFFGNASGAAQSGTFGTSCTGSNLLAIVTGVGGVTNDNWSSVTWGGSAMTKVAAEVHTPGDRWAYEYYLINPPSGSQTVTVNSSPSDFVIFDTACYSGVASFDATGNATSSTVTATSASINLTTTAANEYVIGTLYGAGEGGCSVAHTTVGTNRGASASSADIIDNTAVSPSSVAITCNPASSQGWSKILGGFLPVAAAATFVSGLHIYGFGFF